MFIHLHNHSEYSQLDGLGKPEQYAKRAKELGMSAIAITDHGNVDGAIKWQRACKKAGIKSIIGCEMYVVPDMKIKQKEKKGHLTLLVRNQEGWKALLRMLTIANLEGFYGRPRIDYTLLKSHINEGLILMTGCGNSFLTLPGGRELFDEIVNMSNVECCLEVMPHCMDEQKAVNQLCLDIQRDFSRVPLVATNDCHYVLAGQEKTQEVLLAIQRKAKWNDPNRWRFNISGLHLRTEGEMMVEFGRQGILNLRQAKIAVMNALKIAEQCWDFEIPQQIPSLPKTQYEKEKEGIPAIDILDIFCHMTFSERPDLNTPPYSQRYKYEMTVIRKKNFARYFLIIHELVQWCRQNDITVGPGRGSVGGSLVAYILGITQVDPLRYGLLFERFISKDRIDYPDIDLDFDRLKVDRVKRHLQEEYGEYNVAGISTFMSMQARAVIRDIGRVFDLPAKDVDEFAKSIRGKEHDEDIVMRSRETKEGEDFAGKYPEQFRLACELEGAIRGSGRHPAGLIISGPDLRETERCNLISKEDSPVVNWDLEDSEHVGLIKIDVLKLGTLTILSELEKVAGIKFTNLIFNDAEVFEMIAQDSLAGIFQLTGYDCAKLCREIRIKGLGDIASIISLARPGPKASGMTEQYIRREKGEKWGPLHPAYEEITKETYGVMIYQEQMMRAMTDLAGFSGSDADRIRKVIGKKRDPKEFEPFREAFMDGCIKLGTFSQEQAADFWRGLLEWASYGFCKAHAIEYAMIAYWTAYAKCHHFSEFICASLTYGDDGDKEQLLKETQEKGIQVVTPKVGFSDALKWTVKDSKLYMPFIEIKGIGEKEAQKCADLRPSKQGFFILYQETNSRNATRKVLEEIKAFDPDPFAQPDDYSKYFQFNVENSPPLIAGEDLAITVEKKQSIIDKEALDCQICGLRKQAKQVVLSSPGIYNVMVLAEAPGRQENIQGKGLIGDAGDLLWPELGRHGITRRMLHVGNCCRCFPSKTNTPTHQEINECFNRWMIQEIRSMDCRLILALGGMAYYALTGKTGGITKVSGKIEWIEKIQAWAVWCIHPAFVLRKRSPDNVAMFEKGIRIFAEQFEKGK